jgi:alpha-beta hydrolase superfamily lysophospholipase
VPSWSPDVLPGFSAATLPLPPDEEGEVVATLVRAEPLARTGRAALYVHGFIDYFFQTHVARAITSRGLDFYALDLRRYGRSLRPRQRPNFVRDLRDYYAEITAAIDVVLAEGHEGVVLFGHSTGGLIAALYADDGPRRDRVDALVLNSPFLALNLPAPMRAGAAAAAWVGRFLPRLHLMGGVPPFYGQSLHRDHHGEWEFDTRWKPIEGFSAYFGWLAAVREGHRRVRAGLDVRCPVLVLHSDHSVSARRWSERFRAGDAVLDVAHTRELAAHLGRDVTRVEIPDALHDVTLSRTEVRERALREIGEWLEGLPPQNHRPILTNSA